MDASRHKKEISIGILLSVLATIIWAGNFVIARGISTRIGPVSLAFYRWATASCLMLPIGWKQFTREKALLKANWIYLCFTALTGITLFNTFVYVAGHYTAAINLALVGTTSSPIFATLLAIIFLKERISRLRLAGILICLAGILLLLSRGSMATLLSFRFSKGDWWVLAGAMSFAIYNILVRKKPSHLSSLGFLLVIFTLGTLFLFTGFIIESYLSEAIHWDAAMQSIILYLGAGTSVIAFLCWNKAIEKLGAGRTVLFGNLVPIFSTLEAVWFLNEKITIIHILSGLLVILGLVLANIRLTK